MHTSLRSYYSYYHPYNDLLSLSRLYSRPLPTSPNHFYLFSLSIDATHRTPLLIFITWFLFFQITLRTSVLELSNYFTSVIVYLLSLSTYLSVCWFVPFNIIANLYQTQLKISKYCYRCFAYEQIASIFCTLNANSYTYAYS